MRFSSLIRAPIAAVAAPILVGAILTTAGAGVAFAAAAYVGAAIADSHRPAEDVARDAARKPADMLAFSGVKPGDKVIELLPGGGYFTRLFSKAVGPAGAVYGAVPAADGPEGNQTKGVTAIAADPAYPNVKVVPIGPGMLIPGGADVVWTSQNYHDLYLTRVKLDTAQFDKLLFNAVKPGGVLIVLDHAANAGAPVVATADTLHRIDPEAAKKALVAAGFVYEGESTVLRNPADDHSKNVFDPAIRGHTDQFVYKFRRPK